MLRRSGHPLLLLTLVALAACSASPPDTPQCRASLMTQDLSGGEGHVATCSEACGNSQNPPTAGPHCAQTLPCRVFDTEQSSCSWIHNLEHGHGVLLYNCPEGCPDVVQRLGE